MIDQELEEYRLAVHEHVEAIKDEVDARLRTQLARNRLHKAKQAMWDKEHELTQI